MTFSSSSGEKCIDKVFSDSLSYTVPAKIIIFSRSNKYEAKVCSVIGNIEVSSILLNDSPFPP